MQIVVLGAGMVGRAMAIDLAKDHRVTCIDINLNNLTLLPDGIETRVADLSDTSQYHSLLQNCDMVVCAVPGFMGYKTLEAVIIQGKMWWIFHSFQKMPCNYMSWQSNIALLQL